MKKNILTIIIMAISLINTVLIAVMLFTIVPSADRTNKLIAKVGSIVDLELESPEVTPVIDVGDLESYSFADALTISLASDDGQNHYCSVEVTLSMNTKNKDYKELNPKVESNESAIIEIIETAFSTYTKDEVKPNRDAIKQKILADLKDYFHSDFIVNVTLYNLLIE